MEEQVRQLMRAVEELNGQVQTLNAGRVQDQERIIALSDQRAVDEGRLTELREQLELERKRRGNDRSIIDIKGIGKPKEFDGSDAKWKTFALRLTDFVCGVFENAKDTMEWAVGSVAPIDDLDLAPGDVELNEQFNRQLHSALLHLCEGEALQIVENSDHNGLEAWRKLNRRYDPQTIGRKRSTMARLLQPGTFRIEEVSTALETWERRVREYEKRSRKQRGLTTMSKPG